MSVDKKNREHHKLNPHSEEFLVFNAATMTNTVSLVGAAEAVSHGISSVIQQIGGADGQGQSEKPVNEDTESGAVSGDNNLRAEGSSQNRKILPRKQRSSSGRNKSPRSPSPSKLRKWFQRKLPSSSNTNGSSRASSSKKDEGKSYNTPSPMARMRDRSADQALVVEGSSSTVAAPIYKTVEQVKAEKRRKWKMKMKIAQKKKLKERQELEGGSRGEDIYEQERISSEEIAALIGDQFMDLIGHCGLDGDSESDDSFYGDSGDEDEESQETDDSRSHRSKKSRKPTSMRKMYLQDEKRSSKVDTQSRRNGNSQEISTPPRMKSVPRTDALDSVVSPDNIGFPSQTPSRRPQPSLKGSPQTQSSEESERSASSTVDTRSVDFVKAFVYDMLEGNLALLWHREKDSINPTRVCTRLKPGYRTQAGSYCAPQLAWQAKEIQRSYVINIFDILSLERANPGDLKDFPFAMPSRTICLRMARDQVLFVFEARSEDEAFRFVHGMRWVIARLSFNLVIGNMDVACELLDVGPKSSSATQVHLSLNEEARRACAMDDLTDEFVERTILDLQ